MDHAWTGLGDGLRRRLKPDAGGGPALRRRDRPPSGDTTRHWVSSNWCSAAKTQACLLGARIAGMDVAQLIAPQALALEQGIGAVAPADTVFPPPLLGEGISKACAFAP